MAIIDKTHAARQLLYERLFRSATLAAAILVLVILGGVFVSLVRGAWPALRHFGFAFVTREVWNPVTDEYGALAPIYGTVVTSLIAMALAVPTAFGIALFLTEICPPLLKRPIGTAVELLAAVPSIIFGIWGLFVLAPLLQRYVQPWLIKHAHPVPVIGKLFMGPPFGIGIFTAGLVLAIMVLPFIAHSRVGVVGGIMLGLGRALGETMAVTFVIGNAHRISTSLLAPGTTISSSIANEFTEAVGDLYTSSLIALGLLLFIITFAVIAAAQIMLRRLERRAEA